ncbi:MAG: TM0106 family RecB-like putative nuclease [Candidatus Thiodiazotropha lotti]
MCPTKCYLQSIGELASGNDYTAWHDALSESYRLNNIQQLLANQSDLISTNPGDPRRWKRESWDFALPPVVCAKNMEAAPHAIRRVSSTKPIKSSVFVPVRFVPENKLTRIHKLEAAFDAFVVSKATGENISTAKIIHGNRGLTFTVKAHELLRVIRKTVRLIDTIISASSSPDIILNRNCPTCEFRGLCKKKAIEKNELTLLANLPAKERVRLNRKGIFTVSQLSYTFRPRRRIKRLADKPEKYHHALKALAIREKKIHIVGNPQLCIDGTPIYFDVEGLPDRNFYYLIGILVEGDREVSQQYIWADTESGEESIWRTFLDIVSSINRPVLIHYGSFETTFFKRMCDRYGELPEDSPAAIAIASSINLLSVVYAQVYFPTYSNSLKEIANYLGFEWSDPVSSGLQSIVWRNQWESLNSPDLREKLITYNAEDCKALSVVTQTLIRLLGPNDDDSIATDLPSEIVNTNTLGKSLSSKWKVFKSPVDDFEYINEAAHWDYQRDRVFVRTGVPRRKKRHTPRTNRCNKKPEIVVTIKAPVYCPKCGKRGRTKSRFISRTVQDLVFGRDSIKRRVVQYQFQSYRCRSCNHEYGFNEWYFHARKWGWNVAAYFIYHIVSLYIPQLTVQHNLNRLFGFNLARSTLNNIKIKAANQYLTTKRKILERIVTGRLIHADETRANIKGNLAYVWVLTNLKEVIYILSESREGEIIQDLLRGYNGVLVTDFYTAYESIVCPQQKCLIHLMRDLNNEILNNPFDDDFKSIAVRFAGLLKPIVETIDRFGLKKRYLRKHLKEVSRFYVFLDETNFQSEASLKCKQRFVKNRNSLFTFLYFDGVPWNNNNAEHAIKAFARVRDVIGGSSSKKGIDEYLTLLSVAQTCTYQEIDFLDFLRSGEMDVAVYAQSHFRHR